MNINLMNVRKYIFFNLAALCSYVCTFFVIHFKIADLSPCTHEDEICSGTFDIIFLSLLFRLLVCLFLLGIAEVFIRKLVKKFIIEKHFPNFKLNLNIEIPKFIIISYHVLFFTGFLVGSISILIILLLCVFALIFLTP